MYVTSADNPGDRNHYTSLHKEKINKSGFTLFLYLGFRVGFGIQGSGFKDWVKQNLGCQVTSLISFMCNYNVHVPNSYNDSSCCQV